MSAPKQDYGIKVAIAAVGCDMPNLIRRSVDSSDQKYNVVSPLHLA